MSVEQQLREHYASILPGSFAGVSFSVLGGEISGGWDVTSERQYQRGTRPRLLQPSQRMLSIDGYLTGSTAFVDEEALRRAFDFGEGALDHPWYGRVQAVCTRFSFRHRSEEIAFVAFDAQFELTELTEQDATSAPQSLAETLQAIIDAAAAMADEQAALEQLELLGDSLQLEPPDATGADLTTQVTEQITQGAPATGDIPTAIADMTTAARAAQEGTLTAAEMSAVESEIYNTAAKHDSPALLDQLTALQLFVGVTGAGALAVIDQGDGQNVQALAITGGLTLDVAARRNRAAVANWFARGEVRL